MTKFKIKSSKNISIAKHGHMLKQNGTPYFFSSLTDEFDPNILSEIFANESSDHLRDYFHANDPALIFVSPLAFKLTKYKVDGDIDMYRISDIFHLVSEVQAVLRNRYENGEYTLSDVETRLRDMQYYARVAMVEFAGDKGYLENDTEEAEKETPEPVKVSSEPEPKPSAPAPRPVSIPVVQPASTLGLDGLILNEVVRAISSEQSANVMTQVIEDKLREWGAVPHQVTIKVIQPDNSAVEIDGQHKKFPLLLKSLMVRVNTAIVGSPGSGKTTCVYKIGEALKLPVYSKSLSSQTAVYEFFGHRTADGTYISTDYRKAFEHGGIFLIDEFDNGNANVLAALNQSIENEYCNFPDGEVKKHQDFVAVAAGNTYGNGATMDFVGRNKIDKATLDRFSFMAFDIDEDFEMRIAVNKDWCKKVQAYRKRVAEKRIEAIVSPRATFNGEKLLKAGIPEQEVIEMVIFKGMNEDERNLLKNI